MSDFLWTESDLWTEILSGLRIEILPDLQTEILPVLRTEILPVLQTDLWTENRFERLPGSGHPHTCRHSPGHSLHKCWQSFRDKRGCRTPQILQDTDGSAQDQRQLRSPVLQSLRLHCSGLAALPGLRICCHPGSQSGTDSGLSVVVRRGCFFAAVHQSCCLAAVH